LAIESGNFLDDIKHPNTKKYPNQNIFIILIEIKDYVFLVPYVEDETSIFLKTIIPSRQMNKKYNKGVGNGISNIICSFSYGFWCSFILYISHG